jgi:hypothetical protein
MAFTFKSLNLFKFLFKLIFLEIFNIDPRKKYELFIFYFSKMEIFYMTFFNQKKFKRLKIKKCLRM